MEDFNAPKVAVTLHLTEEAARILHDYAGERNRGRFISQLLVAQRIADDLEGERVALEAKKAAADKAAAAAANARAKYTTGKKKPYR